MENVFCNIQNKHYVGMKGFFFLFFPDGFLFLIIWEVSEYIIYKVLRGKDSDDIISILPVLLQCAWLALLALT